MLLHIIAIIGGFWLLHSMSKDLFDMRETVSRHESTHSNPGLLKTLSSFVSVVYVVFMLFIFACMGGIVYHLIAG
jgi:succinate dehydrogenase hydrophobic anchor subunit